MRRVKVLPLKAKRSWPPDTRGRFALGSLIGACPDLLGRAGFPLFRFSSASPLEEWSPL